MYLYPAPFYSYGGTDIETQDISTTSLKAYWKLQENGNDAFGSYNLTQTNGSWEDGKIGKSFYCGENNTTAHLSLASDLGISGSTTTMFVWYKPKSHPTTNQEMVIMDIRDGGTSVGYRFSYIDTSGVKRIHINRYRNGVVDNIASSTQSLTLETWYLLTATYDGTSVRFYLDGTLKDTVASAGNGSGLSDSFSFCRTANGYLYASGWVDEAGVASRVWNQTEITTLYNSGAGYQYPWTSFTSGTPEFYVSSSDYLLTTTTANGESTMDTTNVKYIVVLLILLAVIIGAGEIRKMLAR